MEDNEVRKIVRDQYGKIAEKSGINLPTASSCCDPVEGNKPLEKIENISCCGSVDDMQFLETEKPTGCGCSNVPLDYNASLGYTEEELKNVPDGANLGLGCGNPTASADIKEGETVLDLGSGAGFDCFLAANKVGISGKIIGVDMTPQMIDKARENALKGDYENVEFRLGEIENLPVADNTVDLIISNCVINLSPDKKRVYEEAFRVLKPGGRITVSDIVLPKELPDSLKENVRAYTGCVSGALLKEDYLRIIEEVGFKEKNILEEKNFPLGIVLGDEFTQETVTSMKIQAFKPI